MSEAIDGGGRVRLGGQRVAVAAQVPAGDFGIGLVALAGNPNLTVDGSGTPVVKSGGPAAGETWYDVHLRLRLIGGTSFKAGVFGGTAAALSSGLVVSVKGTNIALPLKQNDDLAIIGTPSIIEDADGWIVVVDIPVCGVMSGDAGDTVEITVSEDLSGPPSGMTGLIGLLVYRMAA